MQVGDDLAMFALVAATVLMGLLSAGCAHRFYSYLKVHYRELWDKLGRPHAFLNQTTDANRFLLRGQYKDLKDPRLNRLGTIWKLTIISFAAALWLALIFLVLVQR